MNVLVHDFFFLAKRISELQCAYDQRVYLSIMYSLSSGNGRGLWGLDGVGLG
jgi:hypothetical protein